MFNNPIITLSKPEQIEMAKKQEKLSKRGIIIAVLWGFIGSFFLICIFRYFDNQIYINLILLGVSIVFLTTIFVVTYICIYRIQLIEE